MFLAIFWMSLYFISIYLLSLPQAIQLENPLCKYGASKSNRESHGTATTMM
jgi:hypothetical protein